MDHSDRILVIGVGNRFRSDDAAGLLVAERIEKLGPRGIRVITGVSDGASMIDVWQGYDTVYIVDAVVSGEDTGKVYRFDAASGTIPRSFFNRYSTHSFSVAEAVQLAFALDKLPSNVVVFGIEASFFEPGEKVSPEVSGAVLAVVDKIIAEASAIQTSHP